MKIIGLHLTNYRALDDVKLSFPEGIIGILGDNGVGKSSLLESILWCLYGGRAIRGKAEDVRRAGMPKEAVTNVSLNLDMGYYTLNVMREQKASRQDATVWKGGETMAEGAAPVTEYVTSILGHYEHLKATIMSNQGDLAALTSSTPAVRRKLIEDMVGISDLEVMRAEAVKAGKALEQTAIAQRAVIGDTTLEDLEAELRATELQLGTDGGAVGQSELELERLEAERDEAIKQLEAAQESNSKRQKMLAALDKLDQDIKYNNSDWHVTMADIKLADDGEQELAELTAQVATLPQHEATLDRYNKAQHSMDLIPKVQERIKALEAKKDVLMSTHRDAQLQAGSKQGMEKEAEMRQRTIDEWRTSISKRQTELGEINAKIATTDDRRNQLSDMAKDLDAVQSCECPTCHQPVSEKVKADLRKHWIEQTSVFDQCMLRYESQAKRLKYEQRELEKECEILCDNLAELKTQISKIPDDAKLQAMQADIDDLAEDLKQEQDRLEELGWDITGYRPDLHDHLKVTVHELREAKERVAVLQAAMDKREEHKAHLAEVEQMKALLAKEREALEKHIADNHPDIDLAPIKAVANATEERIKAARRHMMVCRETQTKTSMQMDRIRADIDRVSGAMAGLERAEMDRDMQKAATQIFADLKLDLLRRLQPQLTKSASETLATLSGGKYTRLALDDKWNISVDDGGELYDLERFSGGERDNVALAMRLALSQLIADCNGQPFELLVLDEIFGSQDSTHRERLMQTFGRLAERFPQVLIISHIDGIQELLPYRIELTRDGQFTDVATSWGVDA